MFVLVIDDLMILIKVEVSLNGVEMVSQRVFFFYLQLFS